jgi:DNA repair ATPase RecN
VKKQLTELEAAQIELNEAKAAYDSAQAALNDFRKPHDDREVAAQAEIHKWSNKLAELREAWGNALEQNEPVGDIEDEIGGVEIALKRARERLDLLRRRGQRHDESGATLKKLRTDVQRALFLLSEAQGNYVGALRNHVQEKKAEYLSSIEALWAGMAEAREYVRFERPMPGDFEIDFDNLVREFGPLPQWRR